MKKIFTLVAIAAIAFGANAQKVTLLHGTTALADETSYDVGYEEEELAPGISRVSWDAELFMQADPSKQYTVSMTASMANTQICSFGDCRVTNGADQTLSKTGKPESAEPTDLQVHFSLGFMASMITEPNVVYVSVVEVGNPGNNASAIVNFVPKKASEVDAGVSDVMVDNSNAPSEYYNLQGVNVPASTLKRGTVYILKQGNKASKVVF